MAGNELTPHDYDAFGLGENLSELLQGVELARFDETVDELFAKGREILRTDGIEVAVGVPGINIPDKDRRRALVSPESVKYPLDEKNVLYACLYSDETKRRKLGRTPNLFIALDTHPDPTVFESPDPHMIELHDGSDDKLRKGIYVTQGTDKIPDATDAAKLETARGIIDELYCQFQKRHAETVTSDNDHEDSHRVRHALGITAKVGFGLLGAGSSFLLARHLFNADWRCTFNSGLCDIEDFDQRPVTLPRGKAVYMGEQATLEERTFELTTPEYAADKMPEIGDRLEGNGMVANKDSRHGEYSLGLSADDPQDFKGLREVIITSDAAHDSDRNCETVFIRLQGSDDHLKVWTDFRAPQELTVKLVNDVAEFCWTGVQADGTDDPRFVIGREAGPVNR